jgi:hypothetical protein
LALDVSPLGCGSLPPPHGRCADSSSECRSYWVYQIARALQAVSMGDNTRALSEAHARTILVIEKALAIDIEKALQELVMKSEFILIFFNK